jgi:hypothetical protein
MPSSTTNTPPPPRPRPPASGAPAPAPKPATPSPAITIVSFKNTAGGVAAAEAAASGAKARPLDTSRDAVLLKPVISGDRTTWAFLHGALMMGAFGLLLPMGALVARHRWMFGRDPRTVRPLQGWRGVLEGGRGAGAAAA